MLIKIVIPKEINKVITMSGIAFLVILLMNALTLEITNLLTIKQLGALILEQTGTDVLRKSVEISHQILLIVLKDAPFPC